MSDNLSDMSKSASLTFFLFLSDADTTGETNPTFLRDKRKTPYLRLQFPFHVVIIDPFIPLPSSIQTIFFHYQTFKIRRKHFLIFFFFFDDNQKFSFSNLSHFGCFVTITRSEGSIYLF